MNTRKDFTIIPGQPFAFPEIVWYDARVDSKGLPILAPDGSFTPGVRHNIDGLKISSTFTGVIDTTATILLTRDHGIHINESEEICLRLTGKQTSQLASLTGYSVVALDGPNTIVLLRGAIYTDQL